MSATVLSFLSSVTVAFPGKAGALLPVMRLKPAYTRPKESLGWAQARCPPPRALLQLNPCCPQAPQAPTAASLRPVADAVRAQPRGSAVAEDSALRAVPSRCTASASWASSLGQYLL